MTFRPPIAAPALLEAQSSVRHYSAEHQAHAHGHAQMLFALQGRLELEVGGRASYVDNACGMVIPAGVDHGYLAQPQTQVFVIDAPDAAGLDRLRRFAVPPPLRYPTSALSAAAQMALVLEAPSLLPRRGIQLQSLQYQVQAALHEDWPTARLAALSHLSVAQFHARFVELAGCTPQAWLRNLRLDAAVRQLTQGTALEATALRCGYASASALAYALRRERGVTSRQLRSAR
ncbi:AraC family transcriptional regulator [Comamonas aquatilis]|uniref:helix-turn-helix domain-containing protein n=1 Tax=Comamonas aquatilis TaxID=1778406 RepID=UPI0039EEA757